MVRVRGVHGEDRLGQEALVSSSGDHNRFAHADLLALKRRNAQDVHQHPASRADPQGPYQTPPNHGYPWSSQYPPGRSAVNVSDTRYFVIL